jgi:hypothetical protein
VIARLLALFVGALAMTATSAAAEGLDSVRWEYRPLLIFTPQIDHPALGRQSTILAEATAGLADRRMAVYVVEPERVFTTFGAPAPDADAEALRRRFRIPDAAFRVILVGLDGGAKLTADEPVSTGTLFSTIDAMPMRQRELRGRREEE